MLRLIFHGNLRPLLPPRHRCQKSLLYPLTRRASIKDIIESLRIPHTEIGRLLYGGGDIAFDFIPAGHETIEAFPLPPGHDVTHDTILRPACRSGQPIFQADVNVGKLALLLRMAGLNTAYEPALDDRELAIAASDSQRILLSRDRGILKRSVVIHGHLIRAEHPTHQLAEVIALYGLQDHLRPFSRCLHCNTPLETVNKTHILHRLEPLTQKYYHHFKRCPDCDRLFWRGSHLHHMQTTLANALQLATATFLDQ